MNSRVIWLRLGNEAAKSRVESRGFKKSRQHALKKSGTLNSGNLGILVGQNPVFNRNFDSARQLT